MNKLKFFKILSLLLLCLNLGLLFFMFFHRGRHHHMGGPKQVIIKSLNFSQAQVKDYEALIEHHRYQIHTKEREILNLKRNYFQKLKEDTQLDSVNANMRLQISQLVDSVERIHFEHFLAIKKLCKAEQLPKFYELSDKFADIFQPRPKPR